ncbi:hypothetical protein AVEN_35765-1 [Araneus ventricosus]|uniref:Uncharacterized protein n=1 Tax=Araneus ventricosus TaxID=182803 RepID=A0A4Y2QY21_ARAVE|nr:hypothetical protein AVEN_35765-1 [Araneus ventricosus]
MNLFLNSYLLINSPEKLISKFGAKRNRDFDLQKHTGQGLAEAHCDSAVIISSDVDLGSYTGQGSAHTGQDSSHVRTPQLTHGHTGQDLATRPVDLQPATRPTASQYRPWIRIATTGQDSAAIIGSDSAAAIIPWIGKAHTAGPARSSQYWPGGLTAANTYFVTCSHTARTWVQATRVRTAATGQDCGEAHGSGSQLPRVRTAAANTGQGPLRSQYRADSANAQTWRQPARACKGSQATRAVRPAQATGRWIGSQYVTGGPAVR